MNLKEALLSFDGVIDNEYLDQYVNLVNNTFSFSDQNYFEKHHVIPVSFYYKQRDPTMSYSQHRYNIVNADTRNYLVRLPFKQHCLAHWLLCKCTEGKLSYSTRAAFLKMTGVKIKATTLTEEDLDSIQQLRNQVMLDHPFYWSPDETDWLIKNRSKYTRKECATILHKTPMAISHRCNELGITCNTPAHMWTDEEIDYLAANFSNTPTAELAVVLTNHSKSDINHKAWVLGLKKANLPKNHYSIKVMCLETGEIFCSKSAAQKAAGLCANAMVRALKYGAAVSSSNNEKYHNVHFKEL